MSTSANATASITSSLVSSFLSSASASSTSSSAPLNTTAPDLTDPAKGTEGQTLTAFVSALTSGLIIFGIQILAFLLLKEKLARIFKPKTFLVPPRERTSPPPSTPWGWLHAIFIFRDREIIKKCGLDAYFFLRYLQTLLVIFIPMAVIIIPVIIPLNYHGGKGGSYANEFIHGGNHSVANNVTGLDQLAWGNVRPSKTRRYWGHLVLAIFVIIWVCGVFFTELRVYIKVRQDYLTSAEHRLRASATTVLVTAIPQKWLTHEAIAGLYDVFPGGIRNIWINRKFDELLDKIKERDKVFLKLESAETDLIKAAKKQSKKMKQRQEKEDKKITNSKAPTKEEKARKAKLENDDADKLAKSGGVSTGDPHQVPHTVDDAILEEEERQRQQHDESPEVGGHFKLPAIGGGIAAVGKGFGAVGETVFGGARKIGKDFNEQLETTNGFSNIDTNSTAEDEFDQYGRYRPHVNQPRNSDPAAPFGAGADEKERKLQEDSPTSTHGPSVDIPGSRLPGNTVYQHGLDGAMDTGNKRPWEFWKPPSGGFASPRPATANGGNSPTSISELDGDRARSTEQEGTWAKIKSSLPFLNNDETPPRTYGIAFNENYKENATGAKWEEYLKDSDRPKHRLARFTWTTDWLPGLPYMNQKVDTIFWCRGELARLNMEIEEDQKHPERFPLMNSAFIQFNHQVAAHMAAQSVIHHVPKHMAPRTVEISPNDVIWDNMSIKWWEAWLRTFVVIATVAGMVILWVFPVGFTASIAQITTLADEYSWLHWLKRIPSTLLTIMSGILPPLFLAILLALVPPILNLLATVSGVQTGMAKQRSVQHFYFSFLFFQVFLVVTLAGSTVAVLTSSISDVTSVPQTLAQEIPKASNYFFSYMILQALSVSSSSLLQLATLIFWFILPKIFDSTARQKWKRNTTLPHITWGTYFPVYTNFACIALIYSLIAPLIIVFAIITFGLLWIANRYKMLYVSRFKLDTGGLLYPTAINQTFTGLYVMELCLVGLFFLVQDDNGDQSCVPQAIIMIVALIFTVLYQYLLNRSFAPLFSHLPITFEDEAVLRDEAFERAQARRLGIEDESDAAAPLNNDIEMQDLKASPSTRKKLTFRNPAAIMQEAGHWAARSGRKTLNRGSGNDVGVENTAATHAHIRKRKRPDVEEQTRIADALYGGYNDEIEDLTPEERDVLTRHAFQHYALRARRPTVWIPRDDIGVSDDEVKRTREFAGDNIWISNIGAALNSKCNVVYGRNPPDFSEIDLINL